MEEHIYRIQIVVQELDTDGFWDVHNTLEMADTKEKLIESFNILMIRAKEYIENRLI